MRQGSYEPHCEKTGLRGFQPGLTQIGPYNHTRWLEAGNFVYRKKKRDCTIYVANTKALISFAVTGKCHREVDLRLCFRKFKIAGFLTTRLIYPVDIIAYDFNFNHFI